ncbi:MAG: hypothetical protein FH749_13010 [Firmicutes bacterium]|nr:hypothetical protein [Bacillota bacterium]
MMELLLLTIANYFPWILALIALALVLGFVRQVLLIQSGLIKKPAVRSWRIDYDKLRSSFWLAALGGVIAAALHFGLHGWFAFWLLVALLGVGQVLASLLGGSRWSSTTKFHRRWAD